MDKTHCFKRKESTQLEILGGPQPTKGYIWQHDALKYKEYINFVVELLFKRKGVWELHSFPTMDHSCLITSMNDMGDIYFGME